jgi:hypothetical protein
MLLFEFTQSIPYINADRVQSLCLPFLIITLFFIVYELLSCRRSKSFLRSTGTSSVRKIVFFLDRKKTMFSLHRFLAKRDDVSLLCLCVHALVCFLEGILFYIRFFLLFSFSLLFSSSSSILSLTNICSLNINKNKIFEQSNPSTNLAF